MLFIKASLSLALILYFFTQINFTDLKKVISNLEYHNLVVLFVIEMVIVYCWSLRYHLLLNQKININIFEVVKQIYIASFSNSILPSSIGGDGVRIYFASKMGLSIKDSSFIVIFERLFGLSATLIIALVSSLLWEIPKKLIGIIIISNLIFFILIFFVFRKRESIFAYFQQKSDFIENNYEIYLKPLIIIKTFCLSLIYQFLTIYINYYTALSIGIDNVSIFSFLSLMPIVWIVTLLPLTLGGIGLREISLLYLFSILHFSNEDIFTISLGIYLTFFLVALLAY